MQLSQTKRPTQSSYWRIVVAALLIGLFTAVLGITVDRMLHQHRPLFVSDVLEASAGALLAGFAMVRFQQRKRDLLARIQAVEDVNHHVRNALTAVMYSAVLRDDPVLNAIVQDANERIDWTLREVLPRTVASFHPSPFRPSPFDPAAEPGRWGAGLDVDAERRDVVDQ